jgi:hypothetical protein
MYLVVLFILLRYINPTIEQIAKVPILEQREIMVSHDSTPKVPTHNVHDLTPVTLHESSDSPPSYTPPKVPTQELPPPKVPTQELPPPKVPTQESPPYVQDVNGSVIFTSKEIYIDFVKAYLTEESCTHDVQDIWGNIYLAYQIWIYVEGVDKDSKLFSLLYDYVKNFPLFKVKGDESQGITIRSTHILPNWFDFLAGRIFQVEEIVDLMLLTCCYSNSIPCFQSRLTDNTRYEPLRKYYILISTYSQPLRDLRDSVMLQFEEVMQEMRSNLVNTMEQVLVQLLDSDDWWSETYNIIVLCGYKLEKGIESDVHAAMAKHIANYDKRKFIFGDPNTTQFQSILAMHNDVGNNPIIDEKQSPGRRLWGTIRSLRDTYDNWERRGKTLP